MGNKGDRRERELRDRLSDRDCVVIRTAGSGSAPGYDLPDLLTARAGVVMAIECKSWDPDHNRTRYLQEAERIALLRFCGSFEAAEPRVGVRIDGNTEWYLPDPRNLDVTESGHTPLSVDAVEDYPTLDDVLPNRE
jgi:Holliday junction resolvase